MYRISYEKSFEKGAHDCLFLFNYHALNEVCMIFANYSWISEMSNNLVAVFKIKLKNNGQI